MSLTILFVDDEPRHTDVYVQVLRELGHTVEYLQSVDTALEFFKENMERINLLVLDIMMPPGKAFKDTDTEVGLKTGVCFFEVVRGLKPDLPVIVLTNVSDKRVAQKFMEKDNCWFLRKIDHDPYELAQWIKNLISEPQEETK
ncbi:MAG TPA: response regulator [Pyrinomonadaceae bacterium]|jgi:CheY-like chemotaxis protein